MKRLFAILTTLILVISAFADTTTDKITATTVTLNPGGDEETQYMEIYLSAAVLYSAHSMDIYLPEGLEFARDEDDDIDTYIDASCIYPSKKGSVSSHMLMYELHANKNMLATACISGNKQDMTAKEGVIMYVGIKASTFAKPGTAIVKIKNIHLIKSDATDYTTADVEVPVTISTSATAAVSVSGSANWSTCILPFATAVPNGVEAYTCDAKDDAEHNLLLTKSSTIAAYTPYILYSESGFSGSLSGTVDASLYPESGIATAGYLNGSLTAQSISEGYVLQNGTEGVMFYQVNAGSPVSVPAGKCWVTLPADATAKAYGFAFSTSGIGNLVISDNKPNTPNTPDTPYTLSGIKVNNPQAGKVYILGGKKQIIR